MTSINEPTKKIITISGRGIPKPEPNQNTDDIMPGRFLKEPTFLRMGEFVYYNERFVNGKIVGGHPFNDTRYSGGSILLAGENYGTGSSREHAPQGLLRYGIRGIIAQGYSGIFEGNCAEIGITAVSVKKDDLSTLVREVEFDPSTLIIINLETKRVEYKDRSITCEIPEGTRQALMTGSWDVLPLLQANADKVSAVEERLPYLKLE